VEQTHFKTNSAYTIFHVIFQFVSNRQKTAVGRHGNHQKNIETCLERELFLGMTVGFLHQKGKGINPKPTVHQI